MTASDFPAATEVTVIGGARYVVRGSIKEVEALVVGAARGSIMELAWLAEAADGRPLGLNPEHVVALRGVDGSA